MDITIRPADPATPAALACLRAYYEALDARFPAGFDPGPFPGPGLEQMCPPRGVFLLALEDDIALGCVGLRGDGTATGEVKRLWVEPSARRHGLASRLMAEVERQARRIGMTRLVLDTSRHLPEALTFYQTLGWTEIAPYNANPDAHHFFEKPVSGQTAAVDQ
jgi:GNAT superfamily N-acetyltransferase